MGNLISINDTHTSESSRKTRIPKHLQPLKRKQTKKNGRSESDNASSLSHKETPPNNLDHLQHHNQIFFLNQNRHQTLIQQGDNNDQFSHTKDYPYLLPHNETEINRHRVQFYIIRWAFESRHIVPPPLYSLLVEGINILDVGCGPGVWLGHPVLDMAEEFSNSRFESVDICALLPTETIPTMPRLSKKTKDGCTPDVHSVKEDSDSTIIPTIIDIKACADWHPPNFNFTQHNVLQKPLPFPSDTFDYVQQSLTTLAYNKAGWIRVLSDIVRVTKPGGYVQLIEVDLLPYQLGPHGQVWLSKVCDILHDHHGLEPSIARDLDNLLTEAGLEDVKSHFISIPIGIWGLDIGVLWEQNFDSFLDSARPLLLDPLHVDASEYKNQCNLTKEELKKYKAFNNIYVIWGRVPA